MESAIIITVITTIGAVITGVATAWHKVRTSNSDERLALVDDLQIEMQALRLANHNLNSRIDDCNEATNQLVLDLADAKSEVKIRDGEITTLQRQIKMLKAKVQSLRRQRDFARKARDEFAALLNRQISDDDSDPMTIDLVDDVTGNDD